MEGRIIQVVLLTAIAAVIAGSLAWEFYIGPWLRRRRARRRHRHAAQLLSAYRSLTRKFGDAGLKDVWAELARRPRVPAGRGEPDASAVLPTMPFDFN